MVVKKLLSANVGTHYPEPAIIFTELGEIYITMDASGPDGHELVTALDLTKINTRINDLLRGHPLTGIAQVEIDGGVLQVSPIASCFQVVNYPPGTVISAIEGTTSGQPITIMGTGDLLTVEQNQSLKLTADMQLNNSVSTLRLQQKDGIWQELSRSTNV